MVVGSPERGFDQSETFGRGAGEGGCVERLRGEGVGGDVAGGKGGLVGGEGDLVTDRDPGGGVGGRGGAGHERGGLGGAAGTARAHRAGTAFRNVWASSS
ncbi:hypothetical protein ACFT8P_35190 [Streptomyces sp. NPDC057101]|uniref:hypothetical protein n=1 Tax=Streptomyces sp. NPDC057101 TaxID=3346020 RepID=UPI003625BD4C